MKSRLHAHIGTFRQLELLLAVYETGSVKAASEKLFLAQPTVSMQLKKLSDAVGAALYNQVGKKIVFTEVGVIVVNAAREVLERVDLLDMQLADLKGVKAGNLRLAVVTSSKYFAPHLMGAFTNIYPGVNVHLKVGNREQIVDRLSREEDDFYIFSHLPEDIDTNNMEFLKNPLIAIASKRHPLAKKKNISLTSFCKQELIIRELGSGTRHAIDEFLKKRDLQLNIKMTIESNEAIKHAVLSDLGVSILSAHSLALTAGSSDLQRLAVKGFPIHTSWHIAWSKRKPMSPVAKAFFDFLVEDGKKTVDSVISKNQFIG